jgi:hypothetical protein
LIYLDGIAEGKEEEFKVIAALSASGRYDPTTLYPEWFGGKPKGSDTNAGSENVDDSETDFDYAAIKWELPTDSDKTILAQLSEVMSANGAVSVTDDDDAAPASLDFTSDDREWV